MNVYYLWVWLLGVELKWFVFSAGVHYFKVKFASWHALCGVKGLWRSTLTPSHPKASCYFLFISNM